ncbi:MAG: helix-turn-helix domain-containing protein [Bdellovibrionales bacterium]|nr:helix-turn-helix domain-containing protein [Bdellovibrionales bacterium]
MRTFKKVVNGGYHESEEEPSLTPSLPLKLHLSPGTKNECDAPSVAVREPVEANSDLLTPNELADALKVSVNTVYYWISRSEVPYIKVGRHLRFVLKNVLAYFEAQTSVERQEPKRARSLSALKSLGSLKSRGGGRAQSPEME